MFSFLKPTIGTGALDIPPSNLVDNTVLGFLAKKAPELAEYQAHENALQSASNGFHSRQEGVTYRRQFADAIALKVGFSQKALYAESLVQGCRAHPGGIDAMHLVAQQFAGNFMVSQLGNEIIAVAEKEYSDLVQEFEQFKKENAALLKQLKLI